MFEPGNTVKITSPSYHRLYGASPDTEYEIDRLEGNTAVLTNGIYISVKNLEVVEEDFNLSEAVDEKLAEFIQDDYAFTAYDVTSSLREEYPGKDIPHYKVRDIVPTMMEDIGGYERKLIDVGEAVQPWLYYPEGYAPETYQANGGPQVLTLVEELPTADVSAPLGGNVHKFTCKFGV